MGDKEYIIDVDEHTWANCLYGEPTDESYSMVLLGCVHPSKKEYPICYNCSECGKFAKRYKYLTNEK